MRDSKKTNSKWQHFERLVAAIHKAADGGAKVKWDEKINGRQFDVTVRFQKGLYDYLTVVECRDYKKPVSVEKVEAFITKSKDVHAHNAIMASTGGFQSGAIDVAKKHNVTLLSIEPSKNVDFSLFGAKEVGTIDLLNIQKIELEYSNGKLIQLPEESSALTYYANQIIIKRDEQEQSLRSVLADYQPNMLGEELETFKRYTIDITDGCEVIAPKDEDIPRAGISKLHVTAGMTKAKHIKSPVQFEPTLILPDIEVKNIATGSMSKFNPHELSLGIGTKLEEGKFYENPNLNFFYYCEKINGETITLYLVESFQCGQLYQALFDIKQEYQDKYVEVTDKKTIKRLEKRLQVLKEK